MVGAIEIKLAAKLKTKYDRSPLFSVLIYHFDLLGRFIISRLEDIYLMTCWKVRRVLLVLQRRVLKNRRRLSSRHKDTIWVLSTVDINTYMIFLSFPFFFFLYINVNHVLVDVVIRWMESTFEFIDVLFPIESVEVGWFRRSSPIGRPNRQQRRIVIISVVGNNESGWLSELWLPIRSNQQ